MRSYIKSAMRTELDGLAKLPANWDGYGAPPINRAILDAARQFVDLLPEEHVLIRPTIVPMSTGNLQLEWHDGDRVLELEFETSDTVHYLKWEPAAGVEEEDTFPISDIDRTVQLIRWFTTRDRDGRANHSARLPAVEGLDSYYRMSER